MDMTIEDQDLHDPPDFDFFDSPRNTRSRSPMDVSPQRSKKVTSKPPTSIKSSEHGESATYNSRNGQDFNSIAIPTQKRESHQRKGDSTFSYSSESDSETDSISSYSSNCSQPSAASSTGGKSSDVARMVDRRSQEKHKNEVYSSGTASSSAYSDGSSDEETPMKDHKPIRMEPKFSRQAWGKDTVDECEKDLGLVKRPDDKKSRHITFKKERTKKKRSERNYLASDSNDSISELSDSDMTDVSPLGSPGPSPSVPRKNKKVTITDHALEHEQEQQSAEYNHERNPGDVLLKTSQIDMGILMHAVSEIEKERQDRIKANTRRVMFAPAKKFEKDNYSFNSDRTKIIEKENQRLLKELMKHISSNSKHKQDINDEPVKNLSSTSSIRRPTTAAINRKKDQHRIEGENWVSIESLHALIFFLFTSLGHDTISSIRISKLDRTWGPW